MSGIIDDYRFREGDREPQGYIIFRDKFFSGTHSKSPKTSYVAYPVYNDWDIDWLKAYVKSVKWFVGAKYRVNIPEIQDGCHLCIYDQPKRP